MEYRLVPGLPVQRRASVSSANTPAALDFAQISNEYSWFVTLEWQDDHGANQHKTVALVEVAPSAGGGACRVITDAVRAVLIDRHASGSIKTVGAFARF